MRAHRAAGPVEVDFWCLRVPFAGAGAISPELELLASGVGFAAADALSLTLFGRLRGVGFMGFRCRFCRGKRHKSNSIWPAHWSWTYWL